SSSRAARCAFRPLSNNRMKNVCSFCLTVLLAFGLAGCGTSHARKARYHDLPPRKIATTNLPAVTLQNPLSPDLLRPASSPFTLGPGDILELEIVGTPNSRLTTRIGPDGKLYYNLLPGLDLWGLTLTQARALLEKEMGNYLTQPKISV